MQMNGSAPYEELEYSHDEASLNMRGVFLHVLGDALGSVIVVVNALIFTFVWRPCPPGETCFNPCIDSHSTDGNSSSFQRTMVGPCWVLYLDPTLCIIMVGILLYTTYPLLKESALILLQTVPKQIDMHRLNERLLSLDGVLAIHELHIWQLAGSRIIATAHIKCHDPTSYMDVAKRIKDFFHDEGIHATTIQPEFVTVNSESSASLCELSCRTQCAPKLCCGAADKQGVAGTGPAGEGKVLAASAMEVISETPEGAAGAGASVLEQAAAAVVQVVPRTPEPEVIITREVESSL